MITLGAFLLSLYSELIWLVGLMYGLFGFSCFPIIILTYEYASEITFPILESTSSAIFILFSQAIGAGLTYVFIAVKNSVKHKFGVSIGIGVLIVITGTGVISAALIHHINYKKINIIQKEPTAQFQRTFKFK
jgi:hypothetical protein